MITHVSLVQIILLTVILVILPISEKKMLTITVFVSMDTMKPVLKFVYNVTLPVKHVKKVLNVLLVQITDVI